MHFASSEPDGNRWRNLDWIYLPNQEDRPAKLAVYRWSSPRLNPFGDPPIAADVPRPADDERTRKREPK